MDSHGDRMASLEKAIERHHVSLSVFHNSPREISRLLRIEEPASLCIHVSAFKGSNELLWQMFLLLPSIVGHRVVAEESISPKIETQRQETVRRNRKIIKSIAKTVHFCGMQAIALRRYRDDSTAEEDSNKQTSWPYLNFASMLEMK